MQTWNWLLLLHLFVVLMNSSVCTHYRGSMLSWRVINETSPTTVTVEILQRHAWNYTYFTPLCTALTIPSKLPVLGSGNIKCVSTCPTGLSTLGSVQVPCTGYSIREQYAAGEGRFTFSVKRNVSFVASFIGKGWFLLVVSADADWSVAVQIQTYKRSSGYYNNAPVVTMLPVYILRQFQTYVLKINVADNDFDPYRCLWSNGTTQCGNLSANVPGATLDTIGCYLTFTPQIAGYYAVALTVEDFDTPTSPLSAYLSQVPIQFVFRVDNSTNPCWIGPVYVGDLVSDTCIYLTANTTFTTRIRLQVQCANANITNIISVNPTGLTNTGIIPDPFDKSMFIYFVSYYASPQQYGQNLYCFSGVDSIGNQGASTCLRFIIELPSVLLNPLYTKNVTRYPIGTTASTTSTWTILTDVDYQRPTIESYIRFKRLSDNTDVYRLNVVTETTNVVYLSGRLVITTNVIWTPSERYYIYFDSGVLAVASSCTKPSMPIVDPSFWPFNIPFETSTTTTTSTSTTTITTTLRPRTIPTQRTVAIQSTSTLTTSPVSSTLSPRSQTLLTSQSTIQPPFNLAVSEITAIVLGVILLVAILSTIMIGVLRTCLIQTVLVRYGLGEQVYNFRGTQSHSFHDTDPLTRQLSQYKVATNKRVNTYKCDENNHGRSTSLCITETTLVQVNI